MRNTEFSLIEKYFGNTGPKHSATVLSQGDDAAVIEVPPGCQLVMSIDTLIAGVHFPQQTGAADIAHKALAVNLSDLAAMAAEPVCFLLSISLPEIDKRWLTEFSGSLKSVADEYGIELVGGDTCEGPLSITIQVNGLVPSNRYITRSGARQGDLIVVSGQLGNAALGLAQLKAEIDLPESVRSKCLEALNRPRPRLCLAGFLQQYATSAIDLSDGLVGDLRHIIDKSRVGAVIHQHKLPVSDWLSSSALYRYALAGGDDYELCFTLPPAHVDKLDDWNRNNTQCPLTIIGEITGSDYFLMDEQNKTSLESFNGFQHFVD